MKKLITLICLYAIPASAQYQSPEGSGFYEPPAGTCVTLERYAEINQMLEANTKALRAQGILPDEDGQQKTTATMFDWPLRQKTGFNYNSIYGISNYVDNNLAFPNQLRDWNCGTRTYDLSSGYNHGGMDIYLWPFDMNMMDAGQAEIIAAADGIILAKEDGNFDKNCAMGTGQWNAVYLKHTDGTVTWYGHMKNGSLTAKAVGAAVTKGEYLGTVGSSGSSTGPHLHFEVHDAGGNVVDPYNGTCNSSPSMWNAQKPYSEPTVNALLTHSGAPQLNPCPQMHNTKIKDTFSAGQTVVYAIYLHDDPLNNTTNFKVKDPSGAVIESWAKTSTVAYTSSYYYWSYTLPANPVIGKWTFEAVYGTKTHVHDFYVLFPTSVNELDKEAVKLYPNPVKDYVKIEGVTAGTQLQVTNVLGQTMFSGPCPASQTLDTHEWPAGMYLLQCNDAVYRICKQ